MSFEVSGINLSALAKVLQAEGLYAQVAAEVAPETRLVLERPLLSTWHPGRHGEALWAAVIKVGGPAKLEELNLKLTRQSFGPVVRPLVKVALALTGSSPATLFSRLNEAVKVATRGLNVTWAPRSASAGDLTFEYPGPIDRAVVEHGWRGVIRFGEELISQSVRFDGFEALSDRRFVFHISW